jgi:long-chain acyl-CoA synthetase
MTSSRSSLVHHFLENSAHAFPDKTAVIDGGNGADYSSLNRFANKVAHCLSQSGVRLGERVILLSENSLEYVYCFCGILKAGGIAVPLSPDIKPEGLRGLLKELEPKVLIYSSKYQRFLQLIGFAELGISQTLGIGLHSAPSGSAGPFSSLETALEGRREENPGLSIRPESCAAIMYTSGSGGKPRGVMLSHANIVANTESIVDFLRLTPDDVQMVVLPFCYVMGMSLLNTHLAVGGKVVINNKFAYTASVLDQMAREGVTGFSGVPSTYTQLLFKSPLALYREKLPSLRYCSQAGGHLAKQIKLELFKALPDHTQFIVMYGATEASARLTYVPPEYLESKLDSIGVPISGVTIDVLSPEGKVARPGEVGELVARGENIMLGYYKDKDATNRVLDRHGYHTGDLGYYDDEGFFFLTGRMDSQIKVKGYRIDPQEIEDIVIESGLAIECIILMAPDLIMGNKLVGLAVPLKETSDAAGRMIDYCRRTLPKHKIPEHILLVDAIPKNSNGKPDRLRSLELFREKTNQEEIR